MDALMTWHFWQQTGLGLGKLLWQIAIIVIPIMIVMEALKEANLLDKVTQRLAWTVKPFRMSSAAVFPLLAGLAFGLVYGAGMIIQAASEGSLNKRDLYLISLFLVINHSVFEDTLLFVAIGANGWLILTFRFLASVIITCFVGRFILPSENIT